MHEIYPSVDAVRTKLREELNQATKEKRMFADFISFMEYYISLCKDGTILNMTVSICLLRWSHCLTL